MEVRILLLAVRFHRCQSTDGGGLGGVGKRRCGGLHRDLRATEIRSHVNGRAEGASSFAARAEGASSFAARIGALAQATTTL